MALSSKEKIIYEAWIQHPQGSLPEGIKLCTIWRKNHEISDTEGK